MAERIDTVADLPPRDGDPLWQQDFPINRGDELNNSRRQFLRMELPAGSEVWSTQVDGKAEKPARASIL